MWCWRQSKQEKHLPVYVSMFAQVGFDMVSFHRMGKDSHNKNMVTALAF